MRSMTSDRFIGIDIGGTKVRALGVDAQGHTVAETTEPTSPDILTQLTRVITRVGDDSLAAIGVGVPGVVHAKTGVITRVPNVAALEGLALNEWLRTQYDVPVAVDNDVMAAALAEQRLGSPEVELLAVVAAGTGIGLGIVNRGTLVRGDHGGAGEIADLPVHDGRVLEDHVSIFGLLAGYRSAGGDERLTVADVLRSADGGDSAARTAVDEYAHWLSFGIRSVVATIDPGRIVLTGGLGSAAPVMAAVRSALGSSLRDLVVVSQLGADSPVHGATILASDSVRKHVRPG